MNSDTSIPRWKLLAALAFVPGLYFVLLLSILLTVALGGGLILFIATAIDSSGISNAFAGKLLLLMGLGVVVGTIASIRGVIKSFIRTTPAYPAIPFKLEDEPRFKTLVEDLCQKVGTKLPDSTIIHTYNAFFVQNGSAQTLDGRTKGRLLCVSAPMLRNLTVNELRAILAHEFAHFSGNDTSYTTAVLPVYRGAQAALENMYAYKPSAESDWRNLLIYIPLFLPLQLLKLYLIVFHRLNMQLSRAREFRADRIATEICGKQSFVSALSKVVSVGSTFDKASSQIALSGFQGECPHKNIYVEFGNRLNQQFEPSVSDELAEHMNAVEHAMDSHPSLSARISALPDVEPSIKDGDCAAHLFDKVQDYEENLSGFINTIVYRQIKAHREMHQVDGAEA